MRLKKVEIIKYRNFENVVIDFEKSKFPDVFSIASKNGGGKSTLLQFIFIMLHCFRNHSRKAYILNLLNSSNNIKAGTKVAKFIIEDDGTDYYLNFNFINSSAEGRHEAMMNRNYNPIDEIKSFILTFKTDLSDTQLDELSNSVYLTVPDAQPLHFLSEIEDRSEFKKLLPNFSTYEFPTEQSILDSFEHEKQEDFIEMRVNGQYGSNYINFTNELKDFIEGKEIGENKNGTKIIFKLKGSDKRLLSRDLSHGELRKLGIYIWLKSIVNKDSIVLMDEIDIALHPSWQYQLVDELVKWSKGSQFILATHSPQILSSTYYKNIVKLNNGKVTKYFNPPIDRDINAIIVEVMEAPDFPEDLLALHKKYRNLVNKKEHESEDGKKLRAEILEHESESSEFFQDINMDLELI